jgi:hypothetical protein
MMDEVRRMERAEGEVKIDKRNLKERFEVLLDAVKYNESLKTV